MREITCGRPPRPWGWPDVPELPEVDALRAFLDTELAGRRIARLDLASLSVLKTVDPPLHALEGREIDGVRRIGKFLVIDAGDASLVIHLARAGWIQWRDEMPATPPRPGKGPLALRLEVVTADGESAGGFDLTEAGTKKGAAVYVVREVRDVTGIARLGSDALDPALTEEEFSRILAGQGRAQVKGVLRDQSVIAGIGNAYSDEILHRARMSPYAPADGVDAAELYRSMRQVLAEAREAALAADAARLKAEKKSTLRVHGRAGEACPACGDTIREVSYADRSLQYCPGCQTGGKLLADRRMSRLLK